MPAGIFTNPMAPAATASSPPSKKEFTSWRARLEKTILGFKGKDEEKAPPPQGIFGVALQISIKYAHVAISHVDPEGQSFIYGYIPTVVAKCGVFLKEKATEIEGIFRLAGAERRVKELQATFNSPETNYGKNLDWTGYNAHDSANVLRRYLNQLPEPIIPLEYYEAFRAPLEGHQAQAVGEMDHQAPSQGEFHPETAIRDYQRLITELPAHNSQLLLYLLDLLAVFAAKSEQNRMPASNLSSIFQPGILRHPQHDMSPLEYRLNQDVLIFLIENQDHFLVGLPGTETDAKTVQEVESSGSSSKKRDSKILGRSASTTSASPDHSRILGALRRNKSASSKGSKQSNNSPIPTTPPALSTAPLTPTFKPQNTQQSLADSDKKDIRKSNKLQKRRGADKSALSPQGSSISLSVDGALSNGGQPKDTVREAANPAKPTESVSVTTPQHQVKPTDTAPVTTPHHPAEPPNATNVPPQQDQAQPSDVAQDSNDTAPVHNTLDKRASSESEKSGKRSEKSKSSRKSNRSSRSSGGSSGTKEKKRRWRLFRGIGT